MDESAKQPNPLSPSIALLVKLGSIAVHADEYLSPGGHRYDTIAISALLQDEDVQEWMKEMQKMAFLPVKRT
jgi:hypothetical protein